jgi:hypothetical protein
VTVADRLRELVEHGLAGGRGDAGRRLGCVLRELRHDIGSPIGTIVVELYTLRAAAEQLTASPKQDDDPGARALAEKVLAACANLEPTVAELESILEALALWGDKL